MTVSSKRMEKRLGYTAQKATENYCMLVYSEECREMRKQNNAHKKISQEDGRRKRVELKRN